MQIKGEDFLKKVQLQKEKEELERKLTELDESRTNLNSSSSNNLNDYYDNLSNTQNGRYQANNQAQYETDEFDSIMLNNPNLGNKNSNNKKKYLILAILLIVLFLITIIIFRVSSPDSKKDDQFKTNNNALSDDESNINNALDDNYQRIVNNGKSKLNDSVSSVEENLDTIDSIDDSTNTDNTNEISEETLTQAIQKVKKEKSNVKKETKKEDEQKKSVMNLIDNKKPTQSNVRNFSSGTSGFFIQVGAFSKIPSDEYFSEIKKMGLKYKVLKAEVNGKMFNKVIIGPYISYEIASSNIAQIKEMLNLQSAFIVKD